MPDENQKPTEEQIREKIARRREEEGTAGGSSDQGPEITPKFVDDCLQTNELGDGLLFSALYRNKHAFVGQAGEWMSWAGHHWKYDIVTTAHAALADVEGVVEEYNDRLTEALKQLGEAAMNEDKAAHKRAEKRVETIRKRINRLRTEGGRQRCIGFAKTNRELPLAIAGDELDRHPWLLPFANGVVDLRTGQLTPGRSSDYLMRASPVEWKGIDTPCPNWERFVLQIMNDAPEMVAFLQRTFGYGLTGFVNEQKFVVLYGRGRNGKGIFSEIIQHGLGGASDSFGSLAGPIQSEMLLEQGKNRNSAGPSPDIMTLRGLRIAFASETDEGQRFSPSRVKWFTGDDTLTGRYPHDKRNINFQPTHLLVLLTNHKPHAPAHDFAFWERVLLVEFPLSFVDRAPQAENERPVDKTLKHKLLEELPGIMAWLVRGCMAWQKEGLAPPAKVVDATAEYRKDEDMLAEFIEDCCEPFSDGSPDTSRTQSKEMYDAFLWWHRANIGGKKEMSHNTFGKLFQEKYRREKKGGKTWYYGVRITQATLDGMQEQREREGGGAPKKEEKIPL